MKPQEENPSEEENIQNDGSSELQQSYDAESQTRQNEKETLEHIAEQREEMAQAQTGFTGD